MRFTKLGCLVLLLISSAVTADHANSQFFFDQGLRLNAGFNHYYVHAVEACRPELGVTAADRLYPLMPGAGHPVHMPSHIYMRVGRYQDSWNVNVEADVSLTSSRY